MAAAMTPRALFAALLLVVMATAAPPPLHAAAATTTSPLPSLARMGLGSRCREATAPWDCTSRACFNGRCHCRPCTGSGCGGCPAGSFCRRLPAVPRAANVCVGALGDACTRDWQCGSGNCRDGVCQCRVCRGGARGCGGCGPSRYCAFRVLPFEVNACLPRDVPLGGGCAHNVQCGAGTCVAGRCRCRACTTAGCGGCGAGQFCYLRSVFLPNECRAQRPNLRNGASCNLSAQCASRCCVFRVFAQDVCAGRRWGRVCK